MAETAKVQSRGRVTIPASVRDALHLGPGDGLVFIEAGPGRFELRPDNRRPALLRRGRESRLSVPLRRRTDQLELPIER